MRTDSEESIRSLRDEYVAGRIELEEFERRVGLVLHGTSDQRGRPEWVRLAIEADLRRNAPAKS